MSVGHRVFRSISKVYYYQPNVYFKQILHIRTMLENRGVRISDVVILVICVALELCAMYSYFSNINHSIPLLPMLVCSTLTIFVNELPILNSIYILKSKKSYEYKLENSKVNVNNTKFGIFY